MYQTSIEFGEPPLEINHSCRGQSMVGVLLWNIVDTYMFETSHAKNTCKQSRKTIESSYHFPNGHGPIPDSKYSRLTSNIVLVISSQKSSTHILLNTGQRQGTHVGAVNLPPQPGPVR